MTLINIFALGHDLREKEFCFETEDINENSWKDLLLEICQYMCWFVNLQDGVALTIESFSHLPEDLPDTVYREYQQTKADELLGSGKGRLHNCTIDRYLYLSVGFCYYLRPKILCIMTF